MPEFVNNQITITAIQYQWDDEVISMYEAQDKIADFVNTNIAILDEETILLDGVHGQVEVNRGDWVIRQNDQDFYPCSDEVFKQNYSAAPVTWLDRVKAERDELQIKLDGLSKTLSVFPKPDAISDAQWILMPTQQFHMRMYLQTLEKRIAEAEGVDITLVERRTHGSAVDQFIDDYKIQGTATAQTNHALEHSLSQMNNSGLMKYLASEPDRPILHSITEPTFRGSEDQAYGQVSGRCDLSPETDQN